MSNPNTGTWMTEVPLALMHDIEKGQTMLGYNSSNINTDGPLCGMDAVRRAVVRRAYPLTLTSRWNNDEEYVVDNQLEHQMVHLAFSMTERSDGHCVPIPYGMFDFKEVGETASAMKQGGPANAVHFWRNLDMSSVLGSTRDSSISEFIGYYVRSDGRFRRYTDVEWTGAMEDNPMEYLQYLDMLFIRLGTFSDSGHFSGWGPGVHMWYNALYGEGVFEAALRRMGDEYKFLADHLGELNALAELPLNCDDDSE